jgi:hypothetical protein
MGILLIRHDGDNPRDVVSRVEHQETPPGADLNAQGQQDVFLLRKLDGRRTIRRVDVWIFNRLNLKKSFI